MKAKEWNLSNYLPRTPKCPDCGETVTYFGKHRACLVDRYVCKACGKYYFDQNGKLVGREE